MPHPGGDLEGRAKAHKDFAVAGRRHGAARIIGISAGADDRAVADAARQFAGDPACRGRGGKIAVAVACNSADRAVAQRVILLGIRIGQTAPPPLEDVL